ncbi:zinc finger protein ZAT2-like [Momordica charantia]|uniref:Zinc finger protein ZAT2-like n=1 Tax=Momordica charantia TaxID=3673 RepID=A0A6J1CTR4_MOMCH|nr:zinc finger protein ZAT2-like [Momordica charantia]
MGIFACVEKSIRLLLFTRSLQIRAMEQDQEQKQHICKLCNKSFSNGKVLGGHMRCHRTQNQNPSKKRKKNPIDSYSLRENPKKSWKFSAPSPENGESAAPPPQEEKNVCKICGKGFDSSKALFGHMRHHSGRRKDPIRRCKFLTSPQSAAPGDGGGETLGLLRRKRSRRSRCKYDSNPSEVEELALCLLMLSRGEGNWGEHEFNESMYKSHLDDSLSKKMNRGENDLDLDLGSDSEIGRCCEMVEMPKLEDEEQQQQQQQQEGFEIGFCEESEEVGENGVKCLKKSEIDHQCGVCLKVFGSGQALGGHKRAHILKPHLIMELQEQEQDEEEDDDDEFKPWWNVDGDNGQQQLEVGLDCSN